MFFEKVDCLASGGLSGKLPKNDKMCVYIYIKEFISYLVSTSSYY